MSPLSDDIRGFHLGVPGYVTTRLVEIPEIADELGVGRVFVKDESQRFGLPAFKALGAIYAVSRALARRWSIEGEVPSIELLRRYVRDDPRLRLFAATDGNHGRAVARVAALLGIPATVFFPASISDAAKEAIRNEGAETHELAIAYDQVVAEMVAAANEAGADAEIIQDTGWTGYTSVPQWIVDGYDTMCREIDDQLDHLGVKSVDLIAIPAGVGSLAQAVVRHYRSTGFIPSTLIVESVAAPAILESLNHGQPVTVPTGETIMAGMNCGTPSPLAWPVLREGADAAVLITDGEARKAMSDLRDAGLSAGPCGAAGLAGVRAFLPYATLDESSVVVLLNTEDISANPIDQGALE